MKNIVPILLILGLPSVISSEYGTENNGESEPTDTNFGAENETSISSTNGISAMNDGLSSQSLSELHDLAKNISHSKGIYRQNDKESDNEQEIRRSILKKATVVSESDVLKSILQTFKSNENKLKLLEDMEFLVHQYDVAVNFAALGGIEVIMPFLFSPDEKIVLSVASVLGAAMQSNPTVQKLAVKHHVETNLLKLLTHKSPDVLSRIIFALGSLLRNAPEAQLEFIAIDGVLKLSNVIKNHKIATNTKLKIINLFNDLAVEQETIELYHHDWSPAKIQELKRSFTHQVQNCDICKLIPAFLDFQDFDTHQKIVSAMMSLHNICHNDFKDPAINNRLIELLKVYDPESNSKTPVYPNIDRDLGQLLYSDIKALLKKNSQNYSKANIDLKKTEL